MNSKEYKKVEEQFKNYYQEYKDMSSDIIMKYNHSFKVASYMEDLAKRLNLKKSDVYLAKTIGLLHDIGRFEQLKKYNTFDDQKFDHAEFSVYYLFKEGHIRDFLEDNSYDSILLKAILNHNRYQIQDGLKDRELLFAKMIRDMDKVDIYYQLANKKDFHFNSNPSPKVLDDFFHGKCILKKDVKNESDKILQMFAFIFDFNFDESFDILEESNNFTLYINKIIIDKEYKDLFQKIIDYCNTNRYVGDKNGK